MPTFQGQHYLDFAPRPAARATDPPTSHEAAERAERFSTGHYAQILEALRESPGSKTQLSARTGINDVEVGRRISDLLGVGRVLVHSHDGRSASGNRERVYALPGRAEREAT